MVKQRNLVFELSEAGAIYTTYGKQSTTGTFGGDGGPVTAASFKELQSVWVDSVGVSYIADYRNSRVRKVSTSGIVNTLFGTGSNLAGGNGGPATSASVIPFFVCGDTLGTLYVADDSYEVIRKIDTSLIVSTFAGGGTLGGTENTLDNGSAATNAVFFGLWGIATDTNGDVYLANLNAQKVQKVSSSSHILTYVAGTGQTSFPEVNGDGGPATSAKVSSPASIYIDTNNMLYVACGSAIVRRINLLSGIITSYAGTGYSGYSGDGGPATAALLGGSSVYAYGDALGTLYYVTASPAAVRYIECSGIINLFAGNADYLSGYSGDGGEATAALLHSPNAVFVLNTTVYITDTGNNVIRTTVIHEGPVCGDPTSSPTVEPTVSQAPSVVPSLTPSATPTVVPSVGPSVEPTVRPSVLPSRVPSVIPSAAPTHEPTLMPSEMPSVGPTLSSQPSLAPSASPTVRPTTRVPSRKPSATPTVRPSRATVITNAPSALPTFSPTLASVVISFNSTLNLHNVTAPVRRRRLTVSDGALLDDTAQTAVTNAVAVTLDIDYNQVTFVSQQLIGTEGGARRRQLNAGQQTYEVLVTVNVMASTRDFVDAVNQNSSYLYHRLKDSLMNAVESNEFTETVRVQSTTLGAMATLYVGDVNVTVSDYADITLAGPTVDDDRGDDDSLALSAGAIASIVIAGLTVLVVSAYLMVFRPRKQDYAVSRTNEMSA